MLNSSDIYFAVLYNCMQDVWRLHEECEIKITDMNLYRAMHTAQLYYNKAFLFIIILPKAENNYF